MQRIQSWLIIGIVLLLALLVTSVNSETFKFEGQLEQIGVDKATDNPLIIVKTSSGKQLFFMLAGPEAKITTLSGGRFVTSKVEHGMIWNLPTGKPVLVSCTGDKKQVPWEHYYCYDALVSYDREKKAK